MKVYEELEQGSLEWLELKAGKFSASNFGKLCSAKSNAGYKGLINKITFELLGGRGSSYQSPAMKRGTELEPYARRKYQEITFNKVKEVGFIEVSEFVGASPDGLIRSNGGLEIKCLEYNALINYMTTEKISFDYVHQIQGCLWASEREWWDFFVFHPQVETKPQRVYRDETLIKKIEIELEIAVETVKQNLIKLKLCM